MNVTEAQWMAYVDGELDAAAATQVEDAMRRDPALAARVAAQQRLRQRLRSAYAPVLHEPVPPRLVASATRAVAPGARRLPAWLAAAASLALGVLVASWWQGVPRGPLRITDDGMVASAGLEAVLDRGLTTDAPVDGMSAGLSFRSGDGGYCRTFVLAGDALAGLACREGGQWKVVTLASSAAATGALRQASSALPLPVLASVDERIAGEPLDAAGERRARASGWR